MHTITALVLGKKNENMVNIYLDDEYYTNVPIDFVVEYNLKKGRELSDSDLALLELDKLRATAYIYVLNSVSRRSVSVADMRRKLYDKEYPSAVVEEVIAKAKGYNYLDDDYYAKCYVEQNIKRKGSLRIKAELKQHGISDELINKYLKKSDEEVEVALKEAEKFASRLDLTDAKDKNKLIRHMQYKGYNWEIITKCLSYLENEL